MTAFLRVVSIGVGCFLFLCTLSGCGKDESARDELPRAVKLENVREGGEAAQRYSATSRQVKRGELAFEVEGRVKVFGVDVGSRFRKGELLGKLDDEPFRFRAQQADAAVRAAEAMLRERERQKLRQQAMYEDGAISGTTLKEADTAVETARSQLVDAQMNRSLAERALRSCEIRAPFEGSVVARLAEPHSIVSAGRAVLQVEGRDGMQAVAVLPVEVAKSLKVSQVIKAEYLGQKISLRVSNISTHIEGGLFLEVIFDVIDSAVPMSGEIISVLIPVVSTNSPLVPISSVISQPDSSRGQVFVYSPASGRVSSREVRLGDFSGDNKVRVVSGLQLGEQIVVAGAAFLRDGQRVIPFQPERQSEKGVGL